MPTQLEGHMAPLLVDDVEVIVVDVGPRRLAAQVRPAAPKGDFPYQGGSLRHQDQEQPREVRVGRPMLVGELVRADAGLAVDDRNPVTPGEGMNPSAEAACHPQQVLLIQGFIGSGQLPPPGAKP
jgi:hypothetical protein